MRGKISTVDRFLRLFSVRGSRGQAALESMVVLAGLFAFVAVIYGASLPLQAEAQAQADRLDQQAAFESVRFALRLASVSAPGFSMADSFSLARNATVFWDLDSFSWRGPSFNATLVLPFAAPGRLDVSSGVHRFVVRRMTGVVLAVD